MAILGLETEYSLLKSNIRLNELVNYIKKYNYPFLVYADQNSLVSYYKLRWLLQENKINIPLIAGLKINLVTPFKNFLIEIYPLNDNGYQTVLFLLNNYIANDKAIDFSLMEPFLNDIAMVLPLYNLTNNFKDELAIFLLATKNLFLGISNDSIEDSLIIDDIYSWCIAHKVAMVPYHKACYFEPSHNPIYNLIRKIDNNNHHDNINSYHLFSLSEIEKLTATYPQTLNGLNLFLKKCNISYPLVKGELIPFNNQNDNYNLFMQLVTTGLQKKLNTTNIPLEYQIRIAYESKVIKNKNFIDYFLIVADIINWAKNNNIYIGPGRGSAAACLVSYALNITDINPLKFNLYFERFLNSERTGMPDIDIDIPDDKRELVLNYCQQKYGVNHLFTISTFDTFQAKSALRETLRANKINVSLAPLIMNGEINKYHELFLLSQALIGLPRNVSTHPAGIIFSKNNVTKLLPLRRGSQKNYWQAQLESNDLERLGFLKTDFLSLRNLTIINDTITYIQKNNQQFNIKNIVYNDDNTFRLFQRGDTENIFQFESQGMQQLLKDFKPQSFHDLYQLLALYRPGPMDSINDFIKRRQGAAFNYLTPKLEPILKESYGLILYQEQIMQIAHDIAGYSLAQADILRRGISKKNEAILQRERNNFVQGAIKNGYKIEIATQLYQYILEFADYGFNKAHAVSYAVISYQMGYLKANYLLAFTASLLNNYLGDSNTTLKLLKELRRHGYPIYMPHINLSDNKKYAIYDNAIYLPFSIIKGLKPASIDEIITTRKNTNFTNFNDFITRSNLNNDQVSILIKAGAFNHFEPNQKALLKEYQDQVFSMLSGLTPLKQAITNFTLSELTSIEETLWGFNFFYSPYQYLLSLPQSTVYNNLTTIINGQKYLGVITIIKNKISKQGNPYLQVTVADYYCEIEAFIFQEKLFALINNSLNKPLLLELKVSNYKNKPSYIIKAITIIPLKDGSF